MTHQGSQMESATKQGMGLHSLTPKTTALTMGSHLFLKKKLSLKLRDRAFVLDRCHWDWAVGLSTLSLPTRLPETIGLQMWISWFSPLLELPKALCKAKHMTPSIWENKSSHRTGTKTAVAVLMSSSALSLPFWYLLILRLTPTTTPSPRSLSIPPLPPSPSSPTPKYITVLYSLFFFL